MYLFNNINDLYGFPKRRGSAEAQTGLGAKLFTFSWNFLIICRKLPKKSKKWKKNSELGYFFFYFFLSICSLIELWNPHFPQQLAVWYGWLQGFSGCGDKQMHVGRWFKKTNFFWLGCCFFSKRAFYLLSSKFRKLRRLPVGGFIDLLCAFRRVATLWFLWETLWSCVGAIDPV